MELLYDKKNDFQTFSCGNTKVTFDNNGYIVKARGFMSVMWGNQNQDEELIGKHITELAAMLKKYAANQEIYINFLENVVLKFYERNKKENINGTCSIEETYTDEAKNFSKQFVGKLNNNEFEKDNCPQVSEEFIPTDDVIEKELRKYNELLDSGILDIITKDCRTCQNMSCRVENSEKPIEDCLGYIHHEESGPVLTKK